MRTRQKGLTLIELMIVVAVMAVIAAIAYPLYTNQTQKARRADAKVALETIALAQERYYTVNGGYAASLASLQVSTDIQGGSSEEGFYTLTLTGGGQTFSASAEASATEAQGADRANCTTFTLDSTGTKSATGGASSKCW